MNQTTENRLTYLEHKVSEHARVLEPVAGISEYTQNSFFPVPSSSFLIEESSSSSRHSRIKRILETPLGSRVMLPNFGSNLFELIDKTINEEYRLKYIAYTFEAFYDLENGKLWDKELEPKQVIFNSVDSNELKTTLVLSTGEELNYGS